MGPYHYKVLNPALLLPTPPFFPLPKLKFSSVYEHVVTRIMLYIYPVQYACFYCMHCVLHSYTIYLFLFFIAIFCYICTIHFCFYYLYTALYDQTAAFIHIQHYLYAILFGTGYLQNIHRAGDFVIGVHCADYSKLQSQRKYFIYKYQCPSLSLKHNKSIPYITQAL